MKLGDVIRLIRVKHWVKEAFVFAPLMFSLKFTSVVAIGNTLLACIAFALASSSVYILNDIVDVERDRLHPEKKKRPLASGSVSKNAAIIVGVALLIGGIGTVLLVNWISTFVICAYVIVNVGYSLFLKRQPFIEVIIIASGFLLRVAAGATAIEVVLSPWMLLSTFFLALFLGFSKRRKELFADCEGAKHRAVLSQYSVELLNCLIVVTSSLTIIAYSLYVIVSQNINEFGSESFIITIPFVVYGIFRYMYLVFQKNGGDDPAELLFHDRPLIVDIGLWVAVVGGLLIWSAVIGARV